MEEQYVREVDFNKYYYKEKELTTLHREDGPAVEREDGGFEWYLNGARISSEEFSLFKQQKYKESKTNVRTIR